MRKGHMEQRLQVDRFKIAQKDIYVDALTEIKNGEKKTHWMWYIFPQMQELGRSHMAWKYGIQDLEEAREYLADEVLGGRLREISSELLKLEENDAGKIFGWPDVMKLRSSMTLFAYISEDGSVFHEVLNKYYFGEMDEKTLDLIKYDV